MPEPVDIIVVAPRCSPDVQRFEKKLPLACCLEVSMFPLMVMLLTPQVPAVADKVRSFKLEEGCVPSVINATISIQGRRAWEGPMRVACNQSVLKQSLYEAAADQCHLTNPYGRSVESSFSIMIHARRSEINHYVVEASFTLPGSTAQCNQIGTFNQKIERQVSIEPGASAIVEDGALRIELARCPS